MSNPHDTLLRQWHMLRLIPRHPLKITAGTITQKLDQDGYKVTKRTVERDLNHLSGSFPLMLDDRDKPYGWSWQKDAPAFDLPGIDANEALTLIMVEQHLNQLLPASTTEVLSPYFKSAHQFLDHNANQPHMRSWLTKVRTVQPNQPLIAPAIHSDIHRIITKALLSDHQLRIQYKRRGDEKAISYTIHPLALVQRGGIIYLCVRFFNYDGVKLVALHRIESAEMLESKTVYPENFNIDAEIASGKLDFGTGKLIQLRAKFTPAAGEHLYETPLSIDQKIEADKDGSLIVSAKVADTPQLVWWLLAFGSGVEVLAPAALREEMAATLSDAASLYR